MSLPELLPLTENAWQFLLFIIFVLIGFIYYLTYSKGIEHPIIITNLDVESFLWGCRMARSHQDITGHPSLTPHSLLGYKLTTLMSAKEFLSESIDDESYVSVTVGDSAVAEPQVVFKYKNRSVNTKQVEYLLTKACCLCKVSISPPKEGEHVIALDPR